MTSLVTLVVLPLWGQAAPSADESRLQGFRDRLPQWKAALDQLQANGQDIAYPMVSYTVIQNFVTYVEDDLHHTVPDDWANDRRNTDAQMVADAQIKHSGNYSLKITQTTGKADNVFSMIYQMRSVKLEAGKPYTMSIWVRSANPGESCICGGSGWQFRAGFPTTGEEWKRASVTFTPKPADVDFTARIVTANATPGLWLDDAALVAGSEAEVGKNLLSNPGFEESWTQKRAGQQMDEMDAVAKRLDAEIAAARDGDSLPKVSRWTGQARPTIDGPSIIGDVRFDGQSNTFRRPIFFIGYGAFSQVRADLEKFPNYGINLIQIGDFGPAQVFPEEGKINQELLEKNQEMLDRAAKAGVGVDILISPHYVPAWWMAKHPEIISHRSGNDYPYSIHEPVGLELMKQFLDVAIKPIANDPALFSICLTNEPANWESPTPRSRQLWHDWLAAKHHDIATLNARWKTNYKSFDEVPMADPFNASAMPRPSAGWNDYVRWNQEAFADWHAKLAEMVHAVAPNVPVHAKATTWLSISEASQIDDQYGVDPTLFSKFSDLFGNDSLDSYTFGEGDFASIWQREAKAYALFRSIKDIPLFNSENHVIPDRETRPIPALHVRTALWQNAIRGQSATTIWVWERTYDSGSDFYGDIMHRPACAEAVGRVNYDQNRLSAEITALQKAPFDVEILHSTSAIAWDGKRYDQALDQLFTALNFTGLKVGFVTERQLEEGTLPKTSMVFVPNVLHFSDAAREALKRYSGKVVLVGGDDVMSRSEYDEPREVPKSYQRIPFVVDRTTWRDLWKTIWPQLPHPQIQVLDEKGEPIAGVEWRCASTDHGTLVNLCNYLNQPVSVTMPAVQSGDELLTGQEYRPGDIVKLGPLQTALYRCQLANGGTR